MYVLGREGLGTRPAPLGEQSESFVLISIHRSTHLGQRLYVDQFTLLKQLLYEKGEDYMTMYSVQQAFQKLRALKITSNEESVRRCYVRAN